MLVCLRTAPCYQVDHCCIPTLRACSEDRLSSHRFTLIKTMCCRPRGKHPLLRKCEHSNSSSSNGNLPPPPAHSRDGKSKKLKLHILIQRRNVAHAVLSSPLVASRRTPRIHHCAVAAAGEDTSSTRHRGRQQQQLSSKQQTRFVVCGRTSLPCNSRRRETCRSNTSTKRT